MWEWLARYRLLGFWSIFFVAFSAIGLLLSFANDMGNGKGWTDYGATGSVRDHLMFGFYLGASWALFGGLIDLGMWFAGKDPAARTRVIWWTVAWWTVCATFWQASGIDYRTNQWFGVVVLAGTLAVLLAATRRRKGRDAGIDDVGRE